MHHQGKGLYANTVGVRVCIMNQTGHYQHTRTLPWGVHHEGKGLLLTCSIVTIEVITIGRVRVCITKETCDIITIERVRVCITKERGYY